MDAPEGYVWTGKLGQTDIGTLYARCQTLRFSGRLELEDGMNRAEVHFIAGEPAEIEGGDTQQIALWMRGSFRAVQAIPDLNGKLTRQLELAGSINDAKPSALFAWIGQNRLSCDLQIHQLTSQAEVQFVNGRAERVRMDGLEDLAALAKISAWNEGTFRARLLPLFLSEASSPNHPIEPRLERMPPSDSKQFDLTNSIRVHVPKPPPLPSLPPPRKNPLAAAPAVASMSGSGAAAMQADETALIRSTHRVDANAAATENAELVNLKPKSNLLLWAVTTVGLIGAGVLLWLFLQNKGSQITTKPATNTATTNASKVGAKTPAVAIEAHQAPQITNEKTAAVDKSLLAAVPDASIVPPATAPEPKQKPATKVEAANTDEPKAAQPEEIPASLLLPLRKALIEGNAKKAVSGLEQLKKRYPQSSKLLSLLEQARGKLGKAEIVLDGRGIVTIDGHKFHAPKKFHVMAGPHMILQDSASSEFILRKGEKRHFKATTR